MSRKLLVLLAVVLAGCASTAADPEPAKKAEDIIPFAPTTEQTESPTTAPNTTEPPTTAARRTTPSTTATYYANCDEVRQAGKAPLRRGDPGYRSGLDRDGDGTACDTEG